MIKGAVKAEAGPTPNYHTASSHTVPPSQSASAVIHSRESAFVRVKSEAAESTIPRKRFASVALKTPSGLNCFSVGSTSSRSSTRPTTQNVPKRESTLVRIIPEVVNSRKRPSDVALSENPQAVDSLTNSKESSSKKAKTDSIPSKAPLGQVTNTPIVSPSRGVPTTHPSLVMDGSSIFDDPYTKLENIQIAMSIQESALDTIWKKPRLSAEDHQTITDRRNELQRLRIYEKETTNLLMNSVPMNEPIVKREPVVDHIVNRQSHPLTDRRPNVPQPFPMAMEVDRKPFIKPEEPPALSNSCPLFPASSSTLPANEPQFTHPWKLESKPLMTPQKQPVACSKDPSPRFPTYEPFQSDDFDMNLSDSENEDYLPNGNPTITVDLVNRIGINVPPPIDNDAQDGNGDYYGRGRDLFEGPRASADEYVFAPYSVLEFIS